jgi:hypothetical protein
MTAEDLKELGISSFGHRRRLLNAITALGGEPPTRNVAQSATSVTSAPTSTDKAECRLWGERGARGHLRRSASGSIAEAIRQGGEVVEDDQINPVSPQLIQQPVLMLKVQ